MPFALLFFPQQGKWTEQLPWQQTVHSGGDVSACREYMYIFDVIHSERYSSGIMCKGHFDTSAYCTRH